MNQDCSITCNSPAEAVAVVPYLLGFHPAESLVVLGLIDRTVDFTVRYDLPPPDCTDFSGVATLIARQGIERVLILGYGPPDLVTATLDGVRGALAFARVKVDDMIRVADGRWWSYEGGPADGTPCAPGLAAQAVYHGMVALPDRKALMAKVSPVEGAERAEMTAATERARRRARDEMTGDVERWVRSAAREAVRRAERAARDGQQLSADEVAWLGVLLVSPVVLEHVAERTGPDHWRVRLWTDVVRRVDPMLAPGPACLLAYAAWQAGDGALARVAVDRALREDPLHRLAGTLDRLLAAGIRSHSLVVLPPFKARRRPRTGAQREASARPGSGGGRRRRRGARRRSL
jgi:hypothetical protein